MRCTLPAIALAFVGCATVSGPPGDRCGAVPAQAMRMPSRYLAGRFVVTPVSLAGDTLVLFTDSNGEVVDRLWPRSVARLALSERLIGAPGRPGDTTHVRVTKLPSFRAGAAIPSPRQPALLDDWMLVTAPAPGELESFDGLLGPRWFAGRAWLLDYPGRALYELPQAPVADAAAVSPHFAALGFQVDGRGRRTTGYARIGVAVGGDSLDLVFDTGATVTLTDAAVARLGGGPAARATSFVAETVFAGWRRAHPDWPVVEGADRTLAMPMIRVPRLSVAGYEVGPIWFTMRPERSFDERGMSRWTDRPVVGALGGSALRYFRVTVDYPNARAQFERCVDHPEAT